MHLAREKARGFLYSSRQLYDSCPPRAVRVRVQDLASRWLPSKTRSYVSLSSPMAFRQDDGATGTQQPPTEMTAPITGENISTVRHLASRVHGSPSGECPPSARRSPADCFSWECMYVMGNPCHFSGIGPDLGPGRGRSLTALQKSPNCHPQPSRVSTGTARAMERLTTREEPLEPPSITARGEGLTPCERTAFLDQQHMSMPRQWLAVDFSCQATRLMEGRLGWLGGPSEMVSEESSRLGRLDVDVGQEVISTSAKLFTP